MKVIYNRKNRYVRLTPKSKIMVKLLKAALRAAGCDTVNKYGSYESDTSIYINNVSIG